MGNNVLVLVVPLKKKDGRSGSLSEETFHGGISTLFDHFSFLASQDALEVMLVSQSVSH